MLDTQRLIDGAAAFGVPLTAEMAAQMDAYARLLLEWNQNINLTAITDPDEMLVKHFLDSLLLLAAYPPPQGATLLDVGAGAGFPSLPVKIARPDLRLTMLDSLQKRIRFLDAVCAALSLSAQTVHGRAEERARQPAHRERYDLVTARAVAKLPTLCEYCLPFVKPNGVFVALKGSDAAQELRAADNAIRLLGGEVADFKRYTLPDSSERGLIVIRKISQISPKFPRTAAKIAKSPL